jgi:predicted hotdog family 3-hydroxylacyl-ACP dehydratase
MSIQLDADEIYALIPHSGPMRLLDAVLSWDEAGICCSATSHLAASNPLRDQGFLANAHALEYAAQAIAAHNSLSNGRKPLARVFIGAFRDVEMIDGALDHVPDAPLTIKAELDAAGPGGWSYLFDVAADSTLIARGKALVVVPGE